MKNTKKIKESIYLLEFEIETIKKAADGEYPFPDLIHHLNHAHRSLLQLGELFYEMKSPVKIEE